MPDLRRRALSLAVLFAARSAARSRLPPWNPRGLKKSMISSAQPLAFERRGSARIRLGRRHVRVELCQPHVGVAVGWRAPIAARRKAAARRNLRPIRQRRALELALGEEAAQENSEPMTNGRKIVRVTCALR